MPPMQTCGKWWNVGTDDFTLPALIAVFVRLVSIGLTVGVLIYFFVGPEDCPMEESIPPFLYGSLFLLVGVLLLAILNENIIFSISSRGSVVYKMERRKWLKFWLFLRVGTITAEFVILLVCLVAVYGPAPYAAGALECAEFHDGPLVFARVIVILMLATILLYVVGFLVYLDPCGLLCSPKIWGDYETLHQSVAESENHADIGEYLKDSRLGHLHRSHYGYGRIFYKIRGLLFCKNGAGNRSRTTAMQEMALAFHTLFSDSNFVTSDLIAGMILLSRYQKKLRERWCAKENMADHYLNKEFSMVTFKSLPSDQKPDCFEPVPMRKFDPEVKEEVELLDDLVYYMHYAMGIYGWPLHVFDNVFCGLCEICSVTCCACNFKCFNANTRTTPGEGIPRINHDNCCLCGVGTLRLQTQLPEAHILHISYENTAFVAPFSISYDLKKKAIVLTIRGTLSIDDILTDLAISMVEMEEEHRNPEIKGRQFVHKGIYTTASLMLQTIKKHRLLEREFEKPEFQDYGLVVTGHSLGAGVASVLSVILKRDYPNLKCYAYSPPGCIFSFPLAYYSRDFTTSVALGNDMIPRITMQSLFYLKWQIENLLQKCRRSKFQVLFTPRIFEHLPKAIRGFFLKYPDDDEVDRAALNKELEKKMVKEAPKRVSQALEWGGRRFTDVVLAAMKDDKKQKGKLQRVPSNRWRKLKRSVLRSNHLHGFVEGMGRGEQIAGFPPGKIIHIHVVHSKAPWILHHYFKDKLELRHVNGEDLSVIMVDRGMVDDHLPNNVLAALKRCQQEVREVTPWRREEGGNWTREEGGKSRKEEAHEVEQTAVDLGGEEGAQREATPSNNGEGGENGHIEQVDDKEDEPREATPSNREEGGNERNGGTPEIEQVASKESQKRVLSWKRKKRIHKEKRQKDYEADQVAVELDDQEGMAGEQQRVQSSNTPVHETIVEVHGAGEDETAFYNSTYC